MGVTLSGCKPCREGNSSLVKAFEEYANRNFTFLAVSLDLPGAKEEWMKGRWPYLESYL